MGYIAHLCCAVAHFVRDTYALRRDVNSITVFVQLPSGGRYFVFHDALSPP